MANYLIRVRLPDRPGALGAVASRIGAVGGDVISIDILQRDHGLVVDDLGVVLTGSDLVPLLMAEILEVDGVSVEALRHVDGPIPDRDADILGVATSLMRDGTPKDVLEHLADEVIRSLVATFAVALDPDAPWPAATSGEAPPDDELRDQAARYAADDGRDVDTGPDDLAFARLEHAGLILVVGRAGLAFRTRERLRITTLATLADLRWFELNQRAAAG